MVVQSNTVDTFRLEIEECLPIGSFTSKASWLVKGLALNTILAVSETKLRSLYFDGTVSQFWEMGSKITSLHRISSPSENEAFLVGCQNGIVYRLFLQNPIPVLTLEHGSQIEHLSMNLERTKLALVDFHGFLSVYDTNSKRKIWELDTSFIIDGISWNTAAPDILCYSSLGKVYLTMCDSRSLEIHSKGCLLQCHAAQVYTFHQGTLCKTELPLRRVEQW